MYSKLMYVVVVGCVALIGTASVAHAQVGQPEGSFQITIKQGGGIIAQDTVSIGAGGDLVDLRPTWDDGDPEDFVQIGTLGGGEPIILKVTSDGGADESYRVLHWYIDAPLSTTGDDIYLPGPTSLFDPAGGNIDVTITGLEFDNLVPAIPQLQDSDTYLASFLRDRVEGHFYESTSANPYVTSVLDIQVPGSAYLDGNGALYSFAGTSGVHPSWTWGNIENPGLTTTVHDGTGSKLPVAPGEVFELGLSVAFTAVPEPATLTMLAPGLIMLLRRRRR